MPVIEGKAAAGTGKEGMNRLGRLPEPIFLYHIFDPLTCGIPEQCFDTESFETVSVSLPVNPLNKAVQSFRHRIGELAVHIEVVENFIPPVASNRVAKGPELCK